MQGAWLVAITSFDKRPLYILEARILGNNALVIYEIMREPDNVFAATLIHEAPPRRFLDHAENPNGFVVG
jgi:hypothetical protein